VLSGGQELRVAIARALAARPRVLLLDEPFSALDAPLRAEMHDLVRQLRTALSPTILLVTHDQAEAATLADEVAVLSQGRLVQHDTVDRLYSRPTSLTAVRLMGGRNEVPGEVRGHHHHSVLGSLALPVDVRPPQGAGVLVFRQESVHVTDTDDPDALVEGTVVSSRPVGARRLLTIDVAGSARGAAVPYDRAVQVHAETPPGHQVREGDRVGIRLSPHALAVVPDEHGTTPPPPMTGMTPSAADTPTRTGEVSSAP
jgi:putative spermidine/putrescine transport system ATP-binding protein